MVGFILMITYIVVDTSYLVELFEVPGYFNESDATKIKAKFKNAIKQGNRLYLPIPVLFELANHIAHVVDGTKRRELVTRFSETVKQGINPEIVFINIIPCAAFPVASELSDNLEKFVQDFAGKFSQQGLGFTDSAIVLEAQSLKKDHNRVHIWTKDTPLKPYEPDADPNPFIGNRK
jgi:hypothetical protein